MCCLRPKMKHYSIEGYVFLYSVLVALHQHDKYDLYNVIIMQYGNAEGLRRYLQTGKDKEFP